MQVTMLKLQQLQEKNPRLQSGQQAIVMGLMYSEYLGRHFLTMSVDA